MLAENSRTNAVLHPSMMGSYCHLKRYVLRSAGHHKVYMPTYNDSFSSNNFSPDANFFQYMKSLPKFNLNSSLSINDEDIFHEFSKLDDDFSSVPDGIPPALLKMCGSTLCKPLAIIFSTSLSTMESFFHFTDF